MIYFSGEYDTLGSLMKAEGFVGSFDEYVKLFNALNGTDYSGPADSIPPLTPLVMVTSPGLRLNDSRENVVELKQLPIEEKRLLRNMQEEDFDLITQLGMMDIMEDLQGYLSSFMNSSDDPLFETRSQDLKDSLNNISMVDLFTETAGATTFALRNSSLHIGLEDLFGHMRKQLLLFRQLALLEKIDPSKRGSDFFEKKRFLETQIRETKGHIKRLLPKHLNTKLAKILRNSISFEEYNKIRSGKYFSKSVEKMLKNGAVSIKTLELELLDKIGLKKLRFRVKVSAGAKAAGDWFGPYLGIGATAWDTHKTFKRTGSPERATATFAAGLVGIEIATQLVARAGSFRILGALAVGALLGDELLAGTVLFCGPLGWVAFAVTGIFVTGYVGSKTTHMVEQAINDIYDRYGEEVYESVVEFINKAGEGIEQAQREGAQWVESFYDSTKLQVEGAWEATSKWATSVYESYVE